MKLKGKDPVLPHTRAAGILLTCAGTAGGGPLRPALVAVNVEQAGVERYLQKRLGLNGAVLIALPVRVLGRVRALVTPTDLTTRDRAAPRLR